MAEFIKKSHEIVFSQLDLSPVEYDIFALMLNKLAYEDKGKYISESEDAVKNLTIKINSEELQSWFRIEPSKFKNVLYKPCDRLSSKKIGIKTQDGFQFYPLFKKIQYEKGGLTVVPNDFLLPAYFGGSLGYAKISSLEFRELSRDSSKKLYSVLSRFKDSKSGKVGAKTLNELHGLFGLLDQEGKLKKTAHRAFSTFATRVLKPAIAEIENTDPRVKFYSDADQPNNYGFRTVRKGRKIEKVEFLYSWIGQSCERVINLAPVDQAKSIHAKIVAGEDVTDKELVVLKKNLADLVISGFDVCDLARMKLQGINQACN